MKGFDNKKNSEKKIIKNTRNNNFKAQIIRKAFNFHAKGDIAKAIEYYKYFINQGFSDIKVFSNFGVLLQMLGKLKEAEYFIRKAIELNPDYAIAHSNLGGILKDLGKLKDAEFATRKAIELNPNYPDAYSNLGIILKDLGKLKDAEYFIRKAIELNPKYAIAHSNLGTILKDLGKLKEAEYFIRKAIELNPDFASAYFSLSTLKYSNECEKWKNTLFSKEFLNNKKVNDQIDIYFARANILHNDKKYQESSRYLQLGNNLKFDLKKSQTEEIIYKSNMLLIESNKEENNQKKAHQYPQSIFIVGMPRSGSTLVESILSINREVYDLGEINILEESFLEQKKIYQELSLTDIYLKKIKKYINNFNITTNKWLYNYQYAGIISKKITNAKIIHCFRNPLDNILSIYRANFAKGNEYSSSLTDCARIYLDHEETMGKYKNRFRSKIYDLNYDLLVSDPNKEIKTLISWLNWQWNDSYLSPHLNTRSVLTASSVQVRSPINSKSIGGWKKYKDMLKPSMEILTQNDKYQELLS